MWKIKNWNETFENADTRKRVRLGWFLCPTGIDSSGYIELMSHGAKGAQAFGVFIAICQWSATCLPVVRGSCARSDGRPMSARQMASILRIPEDIVTDALKLLSSPDIGWMECVNAEKPSEITPSASGLPLVCQSSADAMPQGEGEGKEKGEGEGEVFCPEPAELASRPAKKPKGAILCTDLSEAYAQIDVIGMASPWLLPYSKVDEWTQTFPGIDVQEHVNRAIQWLQDNPERRKTAKGICKFFFTWLSREQDRSKGNAGLSSRAPANTFQRETPFERNQRNEQQQLQLLADMCALAEEQNARHAAEQQARDASGGLLGYADPSAYHR
jgi:hypothetical protein